MLRALLPVASALFIGSCASLSPWAWELEGGSACKVVFPDSPRSGEALRTVDAAALAPALAEHLPKLSRQRTPTVLRLHLQADPGITAYRSDLSRKELASLTELLRERLEGRTYPKPFFLAIEGRGPGVSIRQAQVECPALLQNEREMRILVQQAVRSYREEADRRLTGAMAARVEFVVNTRGEPEEIRLIRTSTDPDLDARAVILARSFRFEPARVDEAAVEIRMTMPVVFDFNRF